MSIKNKVENQHKPTREDRHNKEIQDLKAENRTLRKQLLRSRKEAQKTLPPEPQDEVTEAEFAKKAPKLGCAKCGGQSKTLIMPSGTILVVCQVCGEKTKRIK